VLAETPCAYPLIWRSDAKSAGLTGFHQSEALACEKAQLNTSKSNHRSMFIGKNKTGSLRCLGVATGSANCQLHVESKTYQFNVM
jgi:hypothetical protein